MTNIILVGSNYFFKQFDDFKSKDKDFVRVIDKGNGFEYIRQLRTNHVCYFDVVKRDKHDIIDYALNNGVAMQVGKFLVPEFCKIFDITIDDLNLLKPLIDKLDKLHRYEKIIYESYIANKSFTLTQEQLQQAYNEYKESRI